MTDSGPEAADSFNFYLKFAKPLVLNLPDPEERILAAAWVKKLRDESSADEKCRREYLKLLLFVLHRRRLAGVFLEKPEEAKLEDVSADRVLELAKEILKKDGRQQKKRMGAGDYPPYVVECSADLLEYAAAQDIPKFGVQGYYAVSSEPATKWENADKGIFPEGIGAPQEPVHKVPSEEKTPCKKKKGGEGEDDEERTPSPRKPEPPLGTPPKPKDDLPPVTWATNLFDVTEPPERDVDSSVGTPATQDEDDDDDLAAFERMASANHLSGLDDFERMAAADLSGLDDQQFDDLDEFERLESAMDRSDLSDAFYDHLAGFGRHDRSGASGTDGDDLAEFEQIEAMMAKEQIAGLNEQELEDLDEFERMEAALATPPPQGATVQDAEEAAALAEFAVMEQMAALYDSPQTPVRAGAPTPPHSARRVTPGTPPPRMATPRRSPSFPTPAHSARRLTPGTPPPRMSPGTPLGAADFPTPAHSARRLTPGTPSPRQTPQAGAVGSPTPPHSARRLTPGTPIRSPQPFTPARSAGPPTPAHSARMLTPGTPPPRMSSQPGTPIATPRGRPTPPHSARQMTPGTPLLRTPKEEVVPKAATPEGQDIVDVANRSLQQVARSESRAELSKYEQYQAHKRKDMPETPPMLSRYKEGRAKADPNATYDPAEFGLSEEEQFTAGSAYDFTPKRVPRSLLGPRTPQKEIEQVFPKVEREPWSEIFFDIQQPELVDDVDDIDIGEAEVPMEDVDTRLRRVMATIRGHAKEEALASAGVGATTPGGALTPERRNLYGTDFPIFEEEMPVFESPVLSPSAQVEQTAEEQWASLYDTTPPPMPGRSQDVPAPRQPTPKKATPRVEDEIPALVLSPDIPKPPTPKLSPVQDLVPTKEKASPKEPKKTAEEIENIAKEQMASLYTTLIAEEAPTGEPQPGTSKQESPKAPAQEDQVTPKRKPRIVVPGWETPEHLKTDPPPTPPPPTPPSPFGPDMPLKIQDVLAFEQMPEEMFYKIPETPPTPPRPFTYEEYIDPFLRTPEQVVDLMAESPDGIAELVAAHEMVPYKNKDFTAVQVGKRRVKIPRHSHRPFREADKISEDPEDFLLPDLLTFTPTPPRRVTRWDRPPPEPSPEAAEEQQVEEQVEAAGDEIRNQAQELFISQFESPRQRDMMRRVMELVEDVEEGGQLVPEMQQLEQEALAQLPAAEGAQDMFAVSPPKDIDELPDVDDVVVSPWQRPPAPPASPPLEIPQFDFQGPIEQFMPKYRPYQLPKMADYAYIPFETPVPRGPDLREPPSPFSPSEIPAFVSTPPVVDIGLFDTPTPMRTAGILPPETPMQRASEPPRRAQPQLRRFPGSAPGKVALAPPAAFDYGTPRAGRPRRTAREGASRRIDFDQYSSPEGAVREGPPAFDFRTPVARRRAEAHGPQQRVARRLDFDQELMSPGTNLREGATAIGGYSPLAPRQPRAAGAPRERRVRRLDFEQQFLSPDSLFKEGKSTVAYVTPQATRPPGGPRRRVPRQLDFEIPPADLTPTGPLADIKARLGHIFTQEELDDYYDVHLMDMPSAAAELRHLPPALMDRNEYANLAGWQTPENLRTTATPPRPEPVQVDPTRYANLTGWQTPEHLQTAQSLPRPMAPLMERNPNLTGWQTPESPPFQLPASPSAVGLSDVDFPDYLATSPELAASPRQLPDDYFPLATEMPFFLEKRQPTQVQKTTTQVIKTPTSTKTTTTKSTQSPKMMSPQPGPSRISPQPGPSRVFQQPGPSRVSPQPGPSRVSPQFGPSDSPMSPGILDMGEMDSSFGSPGAAFLPPSPSPSPVQMTQAEQVAAAAERQYAALMDSPPASPGQQARLQEAISAAERQFAAQMGSSQPPMTPRTPATAIPRPTGHMSTPGTPSGQRIKSPTKRRIATPDLFGKVQGVELGGIEEPDLVAITPPPPPDMEELNKKMLKFAARSAPGQVERSAFEAEGYKRPVPKTPYWYRYRHSEAMSTYTPEKVGAKQYIDRNRPLLERVSEMVSDVPDVQDVPGPPPSPHKQYVFEEPYYSPGLPGGSRPMLEEEVFEFPPTPTTPPPPPSPPRSPLPNIFTAAALEGDDLQQEFLPDDLVFHTPPPGTTPVQSPARSPARSPVRSPARSPTSGSPMQVMTPRTPRTPMTIAPRPEGYVTPGTPVPQTEYERQAEIVKQASPWKSPAVGQIIDYDMLSPGAAARIARDNVEAAAWAQYTALLGSPSALQKVRQRNAIPALYEGMHLLDMPRPIEISEQLPLALMDPRIELEIDSPGPLVLPPRPKRYSPPPPPKRDLFEPGFGLHGADIFEGEPDLIASPTSAFTASEVRQMPSSAFRASEMRQMPPSALKAAEVRQMPTPPQPRQRYGTPASAHLGTGRTPRGRTPERVPNVFDIPVGGHDLFATSPEFLASPGFDDAVSPRMMAEGAPQQPRGRTPQRVPDIFDIPGDDLFATSPELVYSPGSPRAVSPRGVSPRAVSPRAVSPRAVSPQGMPPQAAAPRQESPRVSPSANLRQGSPAVGGASPLAPRPPRAAGAPRERRARRLDFDNVLSPESNLREGSSAMGAVTPRATRPPGGPRQRRGRQLDFESTPDNLTPEGPMAEIRARLGHILTEEEMDPYHDAHLLDMPNAPRETRKLPPALMDKNEYANLAGWQTPEHLRVELPKSYRPPSIHAPFIVEKPRQRQVLNFPSRAPTPRTPRQPVGWQGTPPSGRAQYSPMPQQAAAMRMSPPRQATPSPYQQMGSARTPEQQRLPPGRFSAQRQPDYVEETITEEVTVYGANAADEDDINKPIFGQGTPTIEGQYEEIMDTSPIPIHDQSNMSDFGWLD